MQLQQYKHTQSILTLMRDKAALKSTLGPSTMMQSQTRAVVSEGSAVVNMRLNHSPVRPDKVHSSLSKTSSRRGCLRSTSTSNIRCSTLLPHVPCSQCCQDSEVTRASVDVCLMRLAIWAELHIHQSYGAHPATTTNSLTWHAQLMLC